MSNQIFTCENDDGSQNDAGDGHTELQDATPQIGQEFSSLEETFQFYNEYGRRTGFSVRASYTNKNKVTKEVTSLCFVCSKEGVRSADKRDHLTTKSRAETRTDCKARMKVSLNRKTSMYRVFGFVRDHNHLLHFPSFAHMIPSQRKMPIAQAFEIDLADDSGIKPKATLEFMGRQAGGRDNLGYTRQDHKNYLRSRRQKNLKYGEAGSLLRYFQQQLLENPLFYYAIQMDCEEKITNIFWADPQMIIDYGHFGDVITFDTTFGTNKEYRPFGVFAGFNHHRQTIIFGAALLYDETADSFEWLFKTFLEAHKQKKPLTIFTDQDPAMAKVLPIVMPETRHGLCTWHIMQNGMKHLGFLFKQGNDCMKDFKRCMFDCENEAEFIDAWQSMLLMNNLFENSWLQGIFGLKEKWAKAYMKMAFSIGMRSTQLSESLNSSLKQYLKADLDVMQFFNHFERVVSDKRYNELEAEYSSRQKLPMVRMKKSPMLNQVSQIYTPIIFNLFQEEYDEYQGAFIKCKVEVQPTHEYVVAIVGKNHEYKVLGNHVDETVSCSCRKFETFGILCCHALKVLDVMDIKLVPERYIMKRWTRDARTEIVQNVSRVDVGSDSKLKVSQRYRILCPNLIKLASRAAESEEAFHLITNEATKWRKMVEEICKKKSTAYQDPNKGENESQLKDLLLEKAKGLKKKDRSKGGKRQKSWVEKHGDKKKAISNKKKGEL